jgi:hypothetical protein
MDDMQRDYFRTFMKATIPLDLDSVVAWVSEFLKPEDVFSDTELVTWAQENCTTTIELTK